MPIQHKPRKLLLAGAVAALIGIDSTTVYKWTQQGRLEVWDYAYNEKGGKIALYDEDYCHDFKKRYDEFKGFRDHGISSTT